MKHREKFLNFIRELNNKKLRYVIIRGYDTLPKSPNTDIDLVCHRDSYESLIEITQRYWEQNSDVITPLRLNIEGIDCTYTQWWTTGEFDPEISNGRFTMDTYNHFFFHARNPVVLPNDFEDEIFSKGLNNRDDYYILKPEYEILMYGYRNVFDLDGEFKEKHINIINNLLKKNPNLYDYKSLKSFFLGKDKRTGLVIDRIFENVDKQLTFL